jgi:hypothetical protein
VLLRFRVILLPLLAFDLLHPPRRTEGRFLEYKMHGGPPPRAGRPRRGAEVAAAELGDGGDGGRGGWWR